MSAELRAGRISDYDFEKTQKCNYNLCHIVPFEKNRDGLIEGGGGRASEKEGKREKEREKERERDGERG